MSMTSHCASGPNPRSSEESVLTHTATDGCSHGGGWCRFSAQGRERLLRFRGYLRRVVGNGQRDKKSPDDKRYRRGLPGYHDPTAGIGGAAPASSALTLRLYLAIFGLVTCAALAIWLYVIDAPTGFVVVLVVLAATAVIDIAAVVRRKRRGEPG
jgi:hypothetical protein